MTVADVPAADAIARRALETGSGAPEAQRAAETQLRLRRIVSTDPGGCWVAEDGGRLAGVALSIVREGIWGLSLFAVEPGDQGRGIGRRLIDAALGHAGGTRGGLIVSSTSPSAMRRYARAGFALRPCVSAAGIANRDALGPPAPEIAEPGAAGLALADEIARAVRGAGHGDDLRCYLDVGERLLTFADRGFVVHHGGSPRVLAARDDEAAAALLRAALAASAPGATVSVDFISAGQDWAVRTCLDAGLALSPDGPLFVRGDVGPLRPYLPSGAFL